jgi:hypothetical protein
VVVLPSRSPLQSKKISWHPLAYYPSHQYETQLAVMHTLSLQEEKLRRQIHHLADKMKSHKVQKVRFLIITAGKSIFLANTRACKRLVDMARQRSLVG